MIKITDIHKQTNGYRITLSNRIAFDVSEQTLSQYHLYVQKELEPNEIKEIRQGANFDLAYQQALSYVTRQMRTVGETKAHLRKKDYSRIVIEQVIDRLQENNYLNDQRYASLYVEDKKMYSHDGPKKIGQYLHKKKIDKPIIDQALLSYDIPEQKETIRKQLIKLSQRPVKKPYYKAIKSLKQKFYRYGFQSYIIDEVFQAHMDIIDQMIDESSSFEKDVSKLHNKGVSRYAMKQTLRQKGYSSAQIATLEE
ncbi:MAG: RecX family transcriptional regulator [Candidatus Izemoplasma sp.]|nr:RecX family transcriptional regulator [Candidatus Izemoplasma sp.]